MENGSDELECSSSLRLRVNPGASFWNGTVQTGAFLEAKCKVIILDRW